MAKRQRLKCLSEEQEDALYAACRGRFAERNRAIIELGINTGLRISELLTLNVGDVEGRTWLTVRPETAKYQSGRRVPLNMQAQRAVAKLISHLREREYACDPSASLLQSEVGRRLGPRQVQRLMAELSRQAGFELPVTPHSLRHTFLTRVARATKDLRLVQKLAGHRDLKTTSIYLHASEEELQKAVSAI